MREKSLNKDARTNDDDDDDDVSSDKLIFVSVSQLLKTNYLECIFVNFFQTEISEEDAALREQGAFSPYTVALIVSKKVFFSRGLFENYFPESPSLKIFDACLV